MTPQPLHTRNSQTFKLDLQILFVLASQQCNGPLSRVVLAIAPDSYSIVEARVDTSRFCAECAEI